MRPGVESPDEEMKKSHVWVFGDATLSALEFEE
jgi:hypothetical protein